MTEISEANLQDVPLSSIQVAVPEPLARTTGDYTVEYGIRSDDRAMVFHFFPAGDDWVPDAGNIMKKGIDAAFNVSKVSADFAAELNSFCIIVGELGASLDPWGVVQKFFDALDAGFRAAEA